jgi:hypothetical protein
LTMSTSVIGNGRVLFALSRATWIFMGPREAAVSDLRFWNGRYCIQTILLWNWWRWHPLILNTCTIMNNIALLPLFGSL